MKYRSGIDRHTRIEHRMTLAALDYRNRREQEQREAASVREGEYERLMVLKALESRGK